MALERAAQLVACIAAVGEYVAQPGEAMADGLEQVRRAVAVLHARGVDDHEQQQPERVGENMPLAALDLLAGIEAANPAALGRFHASHCQSRPPSGWPRALPVRARSSPEDG
jgi:hypothetical protein